MPLRNLTGMITHFQPDCRGSWDRELVARVKNSPLFRPGFEEEVGEKGQGAAGVGQAGIGDGEGGGREPGAERVPPPAAHAGLSR